jgi:hypothetical protein
MVQGDERMNSLIIEKKEKYNSQKSKAKIRGIKWEFTFETWCEWWGDDYFNRGTGTSNLVMQRKEDKGPYSPENVIKGPPIQNLRTSGRMRRKRNTNNFAQEHKERLDSLIWAKSNDPEDEKVIDIYSEIFEEKDNPKRFDYSY